MEFHLYTIKRVVVFLVSDKFKKGEICPICFCDIQADFEENVTSWKKRHICIYDGPPNQDEPSSTAITNRINK